MYEEVYKSCLKCKQGCIRIGWLHINALEYLFKHGWISDDFPIIMLVLNWFEGCIMTVLKENGSLIASWKWSRPDLKTYTALLIGLAASLKVSDALKIIDDICRVGLSPGEEVRLKLNLFISDSLVFVSFGFELME